MSDDDGNVRELPVRFRQPPNDSESMLKVVHPYGPEECNHQYFFIGQRMQHVTYLIREGETEVECGHCHVRLDPMWVLKTMAHTENRWKETRKIYQEEMQRLSARSRTKCGNCGMLTRISRA